MALQYASLGMAFLPAGSEWIVLVVIGLLLFGRKLPGIARSLGQSVVEFKKGIKGVQDDINEGVERKEQQSSQQQQREPEKLDAPKQQSADQGQGDRTIDVQAQSRPVAEARETESAAASSGNDDQQRQS